MFKALRNAFKSEVKPEVKEEYKVLREPSVILVSNTYESDELITSMVSESRKGILPLPVLGMIQKQNNAILPTGTDIQNMRFSVSLSHSEGKFNFQEVVSIDGATMYGERQYMVFFSKLFVKSHLVASNMTRLPTPRIFSILEEIAYTLTLKFDSIRMVNEEFVYAILKPMGESASIANHYENLLEIRDKINVTFSRDEG